MKKYIIAGALLLLPLGASQAAADYYLKLDGVEGESSATGQGSASATVQSGMTVEKGTGTVGQTFVLDGTKSQDDGVVRRYSWTQVSGPTVVISNATSVKASVVPQQAGTYVFELSVTDSAGLTTKRQRSEFVVGNDAPSSDDPQEGSTDALLEIKGIEGETENQGVEPDEIDFMDDEESENNAIEPDEIDFSDDGEPLTPDFSILLGGGSDDEEEAQENRDEVADILLQGMQEADMPAESVSMNFEKIKVKMTQTVRLFGLFPIATSATVEIDAEQRVKVRFPWWAVLASGKDKENLGTRVFTTISNVLKTKHDTVKNSIGNIR